MFLYQLAFNKLELREDKDIIYVTAWKSKGIYAPKLIPLYTTFLHNIIFF